MDLKAEDALILIQVSPYRKIEKDFWSCGGGAAIVRMQELIPNGIGFEPINLVPSDPHTIWSVHEDIFSVVHVTTEVGQPGYRKAVFSFPVSPLCESRSLLKAATTTMYPFSVD